jgi:uncharacterized protein (DUF2062 family)
LFIALFYIKPRDLFRRLKKKGLKDFFLENIIRSSDSNAKKSLSIALGVFIGICPFWGFQTVLVLTLATLLRLNKVISFAFSNVSFPPFIPFIIYGSLKIGSYFIASTKPLVFDSNIKLADIQKNLTQYVVGSFILATFMAILFGLTAYLLLSLVNNEKHKKELNA